MGHVVNPISFRLYNIRYWNNNWFTYNNSNYSYLSNQDILLQRFFKRIFSFTLDSTFMGLVFVNLKILRSFNSLSLYIYIHDSFLDLLFFGLKKHARFLRIKKSLNRVMYHKKYRKKLVKTLSGAKNIGKTLRLLKRRKLLRYSRKLFFLFLKNKILNIFWRFFKTAMLFHLKRFFPSLKTDIFIMGLSKKHVNASIVSEFFFIRLKQYYTIWEVLKNINFLFRGLMKKKKRFVKGYKIMCCGRFSRKQRTTYNWKSFGSLALSTVKSRLDYSYRTIALKYSSCTIKVWVRLGKTKRRKLYDFVV